MKIVAIVGSYRRGHITDQAVGAALYAAAAQGAETEKIYLVDKNIRFCDNCRRCTQAKGQDRQPCIYEHRDNMTELLAGLEAADAVIFASPVNFFGVTAIMKRFVERLIVYVYWPWGKGIPKKRKKKLDKQAVVFTSSAAPRWMAKILMRQPRNVLKEASKLIGARPVKCVHFGIAAMNENQSLSKKQVTKAEAAGRLLVSRV